MTATAQILIVDDEPDFIDFMKRELAAGSYDVTAAGGGKDALALLRQREFDAVITDVRMPEASGLDILQAARRLAPETEVVVTTAYASLDVALECLRAGAFDFLQKPFHVEDLLLTLTRALERRRLRAATALYEACQAIFSSRELLRLPAVIVDIARRVLSADDAALMLPDSQGRLYIAYSSGLSPDLQATERVAVGERVAGRVAVDRAPIIINGSAATVERFADVESYGRVQSGIVYPLLADEALVGILTINRTGTERPFLRSDLERAAVVASQALLALQNSKLTSQMLASERLASIGQLAAGVAHEINNPAAFVIGNHAFMKQALDQVDGILAEAGGLPGSGGGRLQQLVGELRQAVQDAEEGAQRIREIVRDLRALAVTEDRAVLADVNEVLRSALRVARGELRRHFVAVTTRLGQDLDVVGAPGRLCQVFVNLVVNAAQAMAQAGPRRELAISSRREGDQVVVELADTGPGIDAKDLSRVFDAFFSTKAASGGTGLGLSISRDILHRYRGELSVRSTRGQGATFTVSLPSARAFNGREASPAGAETQCVAPFPRRRLRLLFVDDEPQLLRTYQRAFSGAHDVVVADDGARALAILSDRQDFDLVVCDLLMPNLTGMEVYERVRTLFPGLDGRFVFVTGGATDEEVSRFLRTVGNQILEKPFDFGSLRAIVDARSKLDP